MNVYNFKNFLTEVQAPLKNKDSMTILDTPLDLKTFLKKHSRKGNIVIHNTPDEIKTHLGNSVKIEKLAQMVGVRTITNVRIAILLNDSNKNLKFKKEIVDFLKTKNQNVVLVGGENSMLNDILVKANKQNLRTGDFTSTFKHISLKVKDAPKDAPKKLL